LQQAKGLGVAVLERPQHAQCVAGFQQRQQLVDGDIFFGTHGLVLLDAVGNAAGFF
jgi:hypothetical protein